MTLWQGLCAGSLALALAGAALVGTGTGRHWLRGLKAEIEVRQMVWQIPNLRRMAGLSVAMPDGVTLATDVYLPREAGPWPVVLVRTPYGKTRNGEVRRWVRLFGPQGYAVVVQDMRGRWGSNGVFAPWPNAARDGVATLDWIVAQPWSTGKVGTIGCSAHGEHQWSLAAAAHPAHRAAVALGSGGAAGEIEDLWNFFGMWEGGVPMLAPAFGWFTQAGGKTRHYMAPVAVDHDEGLRLVPLGAAVARYRADPTDYPALLAGFGQLGWGKAQGYLDGSETIGPAVLVGDTWFDQAVHGSIALWRLAARTAPEAHLRIGPGTHCDETGPFRSGAVGDYPVARADHSADAAYLSFFARHLQAGPRHGQAPVRVYALGADRWEDHARWPPKTAQSHALGLVPGGLGADQGAGQMTVPVDPADPVPSLGGALCCTGNPEDRAGPLDQRPIEDRNDVLVLTSPPLAAPLDLAGPFEARLTVASAREDADVIVRVTEVFPDGRSILIQEGALKLRFRHGVAEPTAMMPGQAEEIRLRLRDTRRTIPAGHRLRVHLAGSSFPRLARPSGQMDSIGGATELLPNELTFYAGSDTVSDLRITSLSPPVFVPLDP